MAHSFKIHQFTKVEEANIFLRRNTNIVDVQTHLAEIKGIDVILIFVIQKIERG